MSTTQAPVRLADPTELPKRTVRFIEVPDRRCFMIDGVGMPDGTAKDAGLTFQAAIQTLYGIGYTVHFALKRRGITTPVGALEALWSWGEAEGEQPPDNTDTPAARWTALLPVPADTTDDEIAAAIEDLRRKTDPVALPLLRVKTLSEGICAEVLYVGPYDEEHPTIEGLHAAIDAAGYRPVGRHHEIYLGDPRRSAPSKLRTIIRQPVA